MDINELKSFGREIEKSALYRRMAKKIFLPGGVGTAKERAKGALNTLDATVGLTGVVGLGGLTYGAVKQPGSIMKSVPSQFK